MLERQRNSDGAACKFKLPLRTTTKRRACHPGRPAAAVPPPRRAPRAASIAAAASARVARGRCNR